MDLQGELDKPTMIVEAINTPLCIINKTIWEKISKDIERLNNPITQLELIDGYTTLHLSTAEHTFFSRTHVMFTKREDILGHKINLKRLKIIETI